MKQDINLKNRQPFHEKWISTFLNFVKQETISILGKEFFHDLVCWTPRLGRVRSSQFQCIFVNIEGTYALVGSEASGHPKKKGQGQLGQLDLSPVSTAAGRLRLSHITQWRNVANTCRPSKSFVHLRTSLGQHVSLPSWHSWQLDNRSLW